MGLILTCVRSMSLCELMGSRTETLVKKHRGQVDTLEHGSSKFSAAMKAMDQGGRHARFANP